MNVFILNTGRCGSTTLIRACQHITNYTSLHESRSSMLAEERLNYPDQHIEADNRLLWFLGQLDEKYGDDAFYVHLKRERVATVASYNRRWHSGVTIVKGFGEHILIRRGNQISDLERLQISADYYDTANANITFFLKDKTHKMEMHLESMNEDFKSFWKKINAKGDQEAALVALNQKYNSSEQPENHAAYRQSIQKKNGLSGFWHRTKLKWAYKRATYWTNFYFGNYMKKQ
ncbi:MAG: hypothetical protein AAF849_18535 [Bacteroidota bacterium]